MLKRIDWDRQLGRRLRLRDLQVFSTVAHCGSMAKAAAELGVSTPTVSEIIANLEHGIGVRLLDRSPRGIEPNRYGHALLKRALAVFDELKQGIKDIEFLDDPTAGEIRIASSLAIASTVIPHIFDRFVKRYPRVVLRFDEVTSSLSPSDFRELRDRKYDLVLARGWAGADYQSADDLTATTLFDDRLAIVVGPKSKWASRRRKLDLADLVDEPWIMQEPQTWNYQILAEACRARGIAMPRAGLVTLSMPVIAHFLADGRFITSMPRSVAYFCSLKVLPIDLPARPWPINIVTLKNRTLSPVVERFVECAREVTKPMRETQPARQRPRPDAGREASALSRLHA
jgi:DNA-binding transcriptional LysR family regulator